MKDIIKLFLIVIFGAVGAIVPFWAAFSLWSWCIAQVPVAAAMAGLIKVGITLAFIFLGGGTVIALAFWLGVVGAMFAAFITGFLD